MKEKIIRLTRGSVIFNTDTPKGIGEKAALKVKLPEEINLDSFTLQGTIKDCRHIRKTETNIYMLEMNIEDLSEKNKSILEAYLDFLERNKILNKIKQNNTELRHALSNLRDKLEELIAVSELMIKESQGKTIVH